MMEMRQELKEQFELANKLIFVKAYDRAKTLFATLLDQDPVTEENLVIHLRRIELMAKLGEAERILSHYRKLQKKSPGELLLDLCAFYAMQYGELAQAADVVQGLQDMLQRYGSHHGIFFGLGLAFEVMENPKRAIFNYEQSIRLNPQWYPSFFGLSQVYYGSGMTAEGDQNFFLFEKLAPYNVYGNFETHRELYQEFLENKHYDEARAAIETLSQWWHESKGRCPDEIQIYEYLAVGKVKKVAGDGKAAGELRSLAWQSADFILETGSAEANLLYFLARVFDEFGEDTYSSRFFQGVLSDPKVKTEMVQRIGAQLISRGNAPKAISIFTDAHRGNPENQEIKFCLLVSRLKAAKIDIETYLAGKERLRGLLEKDQDSVEALALLHSLIAQFDDDPDLHAYMGDLHLKLGNFDRSKRHFERMYAIDPYSSDSVLRLANFYVETLHPERARQVLENADLSAVTEQAKKNELQWIMSNIAQLTSDHQKAIQIISGLQKADVWNISYLVQRIRSFEKLLLQEGKISPEQVEKAAVYDSVLGDEKDSVNWQAYWKATEALKQRGALELAYLRTKLGFMFEPVGLERVRRPMQSATEFSIEEGCRDLLALVNTNFDGPDIYWGLGRLHKELWQLEVSNMWLLIGLEKTGEEDTHRSSLLAELADNYLWRGEQRKAIEYAQLALELVKSGNQQATAATTLSHAYLKNGDIQRARFYLEMIDSEPSFDSVFLRGLIHYRNGHEAQAKSIWKPLIKQASLTPRAHYMKQQLMSFYYDAAPYLKAN